jgi:hypothetical protein
MKEKWKHIKGFEGYYQVSNKGRIKSLDRYVEYKNGYKRLHKGKILRILKDTAGYCQVNLWKNGKLKRRSVHKLVADAFIVNCEHLPQVNHVDGDKDNNHVLNLEWCSASYNVKHAYDNNLKSGNFGSKNGSSKLKESDIIDIRNMLSSGYYLKDIAKKYNVSISTISGIKLGKYWTKV